MDTENGLWKYHVNITHMSITLGLMDFLSLSQRLIKVCFETHVQKPRPHMLIFGIFTMLDLNFSAMCATKKLQLYPK